MKKLNALLVLVSCLGMVHSSFGQTSDQKNAIVYKGILSDFLTAEDRYSNDNFAYFNTKRKLSPCTEIGYYRFLNNSFNLGLPVKMGTSLLNEPNFDGKLFTSLDANLIFKLNNGYLFKEKAKIAPYIYGGLGVRRYWSSAQKWDLQIPTGAGLNVYITEGVRFLVGIERTNSISAKRNSLQYQGGFVFLLGEKKDLDNDGIIDEKDECPTVAGVAAFKGCPDTDGDGVPNSLDYCPEVKGLEVLNGCPDTDADGIADGTDNCPNEAGSPTLNGCPDTDGDGIANAMDNCPNEAGSPALNGCPDTDGDGIANATDNCPNVAGLRAFAGCPDTDGDNIQDSEDKCPNVAGLRAFVGCPDTDGDNIQDSEDKCPKEKGDKANNGCPPPAAPIITDVDVDGIADKEDACPSVKGLPKFKGCPDTDGDDIQDSEDRCPTQAGIAANKGCPEIKEADKKVLINAMELEFETGSSKFTGNAIATLDKVVEVLNKYPEYKMSIQGHTDNQGNANSNLKLSDARAKACYDYIIEKGIKLVRVSYTGLGDTQPLGDNKTSEGRKKNRRVEFIPYL